jgi:hypothetical protein
MKSFSLFPSDGTEEKAKPRLDLYMNFFFNPGRTNTNRAVRVGDIYISCRHPGRGGSKAKKGTLLSQAER